MKRNKTLLIWIAAGILLLLAFSVLSSSSSGPVHVTASEFIEMVNKGQIENATFVGNTVIGVVKSKNEGEKATSRVRAEVTFSGASMVEALNAKEVPYSEQTPADFGWIWSVIIIVIIIGVILFVVRRGSGGTSQMGLIGKHKGAEVSKQINVRFDDVAGADEAKLEVSEIVDYLREPSSFASLGAKAPKGILLMGSPGTGKTLMARAMAGEAGVPFIEIAGSEFVELYVGVGAARVRSLFEDAKKLAPCIIFIDEIDAVGRQRGGGGKGNSHDEREQTLNQILTEMDGFENNNGVVVIAATNRPDILDNALLRPGRFDRKVVMPRPDVRGRLAILQIHSRGKPLAADVDLETLAKTTTNMSGADLEYIMNEAAILAVREKATEISKAHLSQARDKSIMGAERRSQVLSDGVKRVIAWHEAGHALVAHLTYGCDPVERVSIIPRGSALGVTIIRPEEDTVLQSKTELLGQMRMLMGGRMAELVKFGEAHVTTGASNDIQRATSIAAAMVKEYGMSNLGNRAFTARDEGFIYDITQRDFSEGTAVKIDEVVSSLVDDATNDAKSLIKGNMGKLNRLAELLLERETIDDKEVAEILGPRATTA